MGIDRPVSRQENLQGLLRKHGKYLAVVLIVTAIMLFLWGQVDWHTPPWDTSDGFNYRRVAQAAPGFSDQVPAPFRFRLLGTYTLGLLPVDTISGFYLLNYGLFFLLVVLLYAFLCYVGIIPPVAAFATILFTFNKHLFGVTTWLVFHTNDTIALISLLIIFWAMFERRWILFGVVLFLSAVARETWIIVPPTALLYLWERNDLRSDGWKVIAATIPALLITAAIRAGLTADVPGSIGLIGAIERYAPKVFEPAFWVRQWGNTLIPLTLLPVVFLRTTVAFFKRNTYMIGYLLIVFLTSLLGSSNERLMAPAFLSFYWLLALIIQDNIYPSKLMLLIIGAASFATSLHYRQARFPILSREDTIVVSLIALAAVTIAAIIFKFASPKKGQPTASPSSVSP
ncbi:MAG: hypothetical protein U9R25_03845 [Chloroflexota bacterium]|nr:hypothetical protein [Chloroflexota bacterium]